MHFSVVYREMIQQLMGVLNRSLRFHLAALHAIRGDSQGAVTAVRQAMQDGFVCMPCMSWPHFDRLLGEPDFEVLVDEMQAKVDAQRQRLADEGMLLTPEEVLQLEDFSFDPFLNK
jgi:hypothetical protein